MKELLQIVRAREASPGAAFALATVVHVEGSSYRRPGARMLIGVNGQIAGSVSGGCLERHVVSRGLEAIVHQRAELLSYDTTDEDDLAFGTSLGCEGKVEILVEPVPVGSPWALAEIVQRVVAERRPAALATVYRTAKARTDLSGRLFWCFAEGEEGGSATDEIADRLRPELAALLAEGKGKARSVSVTHGGDPIECLIERIAPPLALVLFGGGHDVPPLVRLAKELGHEVTVIDRRADFADPLRFPGADRVIHAKGKRILDFIPGGAAAVVMNHHYETDRAVLGHLLEAAAPPAYIGMLGPRKRTVKITGELGHADALDRVHAPAGLDLGSENPEQIALAILAEIEAVRCGRSGRSLRDRPGPIHAAEERCLPSAA